MINLEKKATFISFFEFQVTSLSNEKNLDKNYERIMCLFYSYFIAYTNIQ